MNKNLASRQGLGLFAWIAAGLGLFIIAALIIFTLRLSDNFQQEIAYNRLESSLSDNDFKQAKKYSTFLLQQNNPSAFNNLPLDAVLRLASHSAPDPIALLPELQLSLKELGEDTELLEELRVLIENEIQQMVRKQEIFDLSSNQYQELESDRETIKQRFYLLASDLYNLLSVSSRRPDGFSYYQGGILANLPIIEGIKDNIPDTSTLNEQLFLIGGEINRTPGAPADDFVNRVNQLRSSSLRLIEQDKSLKSRSSELEKEQRRLKAELKKSYEDLSQSTGKLLLMLSKNAPTPSS